MTDPLEPTVVKCSDILNEYEEMANSGILPHSHLGTSCLSSMRFRASNVRSHSHL